MAGITPLRTRDQKTPADVCPVNIDMNLFLQKTDFIV